MYVTPSAHVPCAVLYSSFISKQPYLSHALNNQLTESSSSTRPGRSKELKSPLNACQETLQLGMFRDRRVKVARKWNDEGINTLIIDQKIDYVAS